MNDYLNDKIFLRELDEMPEKEQYIRIIVLDQNEYELEEIQGYVTSGGTLSINGDSSVRRTCTLNMIADDKYRNVMETSNLLSINKRIKIFIGYANRTAKYQEEEIIWFPLGIFIIINPNISRGTNGVSISLSLQDKMCLLNGSRGGIIPAYCIFDKVDEVTPSGDIETKKIPIYQIIQEVVNHFGNIPLEKIIIKDIDTIAKEVLRWNNSSKKLCVNYSTNQVMIADNDAELLDTWEKIFYEGDDIGFHYTDFYYDEELTANQGDNVCTILDKIKNKLGNYEYFFDTQGYFHFQEKKNYYNTTKASAQNLEQIQYNTTPSTVYSTYNFDNSNLIVSYQNTPQYDMVKNDFIIWGKRKTAEDKEVPIRYHLTLDKKPPLRKTCNFVQWDYTQLVDKDKEIYETTTLIKPPIEISTNSSRPSQGYPGMIYHTKDLDEYSYWEDNSWKTIDKDNNDTNLKIYKDIAIKDWRTELYIQGCLSERYATDSNYYYTELVNEWTKIYDVIKGKFKEKSIEQCSNIDYFLDFIEKGEAYNNISVSTIGRMTKVVSDDKVNCIFEPIIEDYVFCYTAEEIKWCQDRGQKYLNVSSLLDKDKNNLIEINTILGGTLNSAYNLMKDLIYEYTNYNESITLQCLPIYYLEPNMIITVEDKESLISGEYVINSMTIPMDLGGTMSITAKRVIQRR